MDDWRLGPGGAAVGGLPAGAEVLDSGVLPRMEEMIEYSRLAASVGP